MLHTREILSLARTASCPGVCKQSDGFSFSPLKLLGSLNVPLNNRSKNGPQREASLTKGKKKKSRLQGNRTGPLRRSLMTGSEGRLSAEHNAPAARAPGAGHAAQHGTRTSLGDLQGSRVRRFRGRGISSIFKHLDLEKSATAISAEKGTGDHLTPPCSRFLQRLQGFWCTFLFRLLKFRCLAILLPTGFLKKLRAHLRKKKSELGIRPPGRSVAASRSPTAPSAHGPGLVTRSRYWHLAESSFLFACFVLLI